MPQPALMPAIEKFPRAPAAMHRLSVTQPHKNLSIFR
jgi:hypothetical protein